MTQANFRPLPTRCPDCDRILGHDHRDDCKILTAKPLPSEVEVAAWVASNA